MVNLIQGDCLEVMKDIPDNSVDMILCDLPYGITRNKWDFLIPMNDHVDGVYYDAFMMNQFKLGVVFQDAYNLWESRKQLGLWGQYNRIIKKNGAICLFADGMFMANLMISNQKVWKYNIIWDKVLKSGFLNANRMPLRQTEEIVVFYNKQPTYNPQKTNGKPNHSKGNIAKNKVQSVNNNYGDYIVVDNKNLGDMKYPTSILSFQKTHPSKSVHPTQKPVDLLEYLIRTYTNEGDTVLDNCMGSGSTGVACVNIGRNFIGIEKDPQYFAIAKQRIESVKNSV